MVAFSKPLVAVVALAASVDASQLTSGEAALKSVHKHSHGHPRRHSWNKHHVVEEKEEPKKEGAADAVTGFFHSVEAKVEGSVEKASK